MGTMESLNTNIQVNRNQFSFKCIIGRGGFGKVWKVVYKRTNAYYALKEMSKVKVIDKKSEKCIMAERNILARLHNPFLVNMIYSFQDYSFVYLVLDLLQGGDLRYHFGRQKRFTEEQTKFFMICIILGLEYIHKNQIIHRDIKPENLVFDERGYLRITDFGIALRDGPDNEYETSGTPGYMAPEVICSENHTHLVDYFALGVIGYECMIGSRPYLGRSRREIKNNMLSVQVQIKPNEVPLGWSFEAADLINLLIQRKPAKRLGYHGIDEIKNHNWFKEVNWDDYAEKKAISPFIPKQGNNFDNKYCDAQEQIGLDTQERYRLYQENEKYSSLFSNYTYNNISQEELKLLLSPMSSNSTRSSPIEHRLHLGLKGSPFNQMLLTPNKSSLQNIKHRTIYLSNSNRSLAKNEEKTPDKTILPKIAPSSSMHKSVSSMSLYKTNNNGSQTTKRKVNKGVIRQSFLKPNSPIMLIKRLSHNYVPKDITKNSNQTIILKESEKE